MAKLIRKFPVLGMEEVMTAAGLITFLNGEAEVDEEQASALEGVSDIRVKREVQAASTNPDESAALQAAADAEAKRLADEKAQADADADAEAKRLADEKAQADADAEAKRLADEKQAEDVQKQADADATQKAADELAKNAAPAAPANKKTPPALK